MSEQQTLFAPGCALRAYKPRLIDRMTSFLTEAGIVSGAYLTCCKAERSVPGPVTLITCCPGCDHAFSTRHTQVSTVSLWKVLSGTDFPFPDYRNERMAIHDSCPRRGRDSAEMAAAVRALCQTMRIDLAEPLPSPDEPMCCGGCAAVAAERIAMARRRAGYLPLGDAVVYCTGCVRSLSVTSVRPRHVLDLLYGEPTEGLTLKS